METITLLFLLVVGGGLVVYSLMPNRQSERDAVKRRLLGRRSADEVAEIQEKARKTATDDLIKKASPTLGRLIMPISDEEQTNLRLKLANAGFRNAGAQTIFLASKTILGVAGLVIAGIVGLSAGYQMTTTASVVAFAGGLGFMLPNLWLTVAVGGRRDKVRCGLPDTLDLLVVSVESGLALDAALKRVGDEMTTVHPELSEEMRIATAETQMGIPRGEALENMARRVGLEEMRSLVSVVLQAEKFGTSIAKALRNQADSLRTKRRQAAEERAQKTAVKLMIPLVLFIFPAMGVVLAGPAALKMLEALKNNPTLN
ncbi:MAG: type II secretion system F family protein [Phycisphaerae bacterium]